MLPPMGNDMSYDMSSMSGTSSLASYDSPLIRARRRDDLTLTTLESTGTTISQQPRETLDDIHHFCRLLECRMRALDRRAQFQLQIKILQLLYDTEFGEM